MTRILRPAWLARFGSVKPISGLWGYDRGAPVDRFYIESFLERHRRDIRGAVLEIKDGTYTDRFGSGVTRRDILDIDPANRRATLRADLAHADTIESERFDCCILTQTLQYVYDLESAVRHLHRILRPGGVLLVTLPATTRMDLDAPGGDFWRFTTASSRRLFGSVFGSDQIEVESWGNVLSAMASLTGLASQDLSHKKLTARDPRFPVIVSVRAARRPPASPAADGTSQP